MAGPRVPHVSDLGIHYVCAGLFPYRLSGGGRCIFNIVPRLSHGRLLRLLTSGGSAAGFTSTGRTTSCAGSPSSASSSSDRPDREDSRVEAGLAPGREV